MDTRKIILFTFFVILTGLSYAQQRPVLFGGFDYYRNKSYDANSYGNINLGFQIYQWKFLAPEAGFNYYFGNLRDSKLPNSIDSQARAPKISDGRYGAAVFSVSPKLVFGNSEAALVIIPQYNFGTIRSRGDFLVDSGDNYLLDEQIKHNESISFWSIAVGIEGNFFDSEYLFFNFFLKYTLFDSKDSLESIQVPNGFPNLNKGSSDGIGVGARIYFDFLEILKKK